MASPSYRGEAQCLPANRPFKVSSLSHRGPNSREGVARRRRTFTVFQVKKKVSRVKKERGVVTTEAEHHAAVERGARGGGGGVASLERPSLE